MWVSEMQMCKNSVKGLKGNVTAKGIIYVLKDPLNLSQWHKALVLMLILQPKISLQCHFCPWCWKLKKIVLYKSCFLDLNSIYIQSSIVYAPVFSLKCISKFLYVNYDHLIEK